MYQPRDYQQPGIDACIEILTSPKPRREIVVSPTGGGKSLYIAFAAKFVDFPLIILQPSKELLKQNYTKFVELGGEAEIYSASMKTLNIGHVTFATIGSIAKCVNQIKALKVPAIIIDEAHLGTKSTSMIRNFISATGIKNVLGLTATPVYLENTMNGAELKMMTKVKGKLFTDIAHVTQIQELVEKKFWSPLDYFVQRQDEKFLKSNSNGSDYTLESQREFYNENYLETKICRHTQNLLSKGRKSILIFVPSIEEAVSLSNRIPGSGYVHSKMPDKERDRVVDSFRNLETNVVINVNILSVGFDHPQLDAIITARSTMSMQIYYQQIGRGVRIHPEKIDCKVVDLSGNFFKFGRVEDLNYEYIDGFGWGMFTNEELISNYPLAGQIRPTKESLRRGIEHKRKQIFEIKHFEKSGEIWFGKHKGLTVEQIEKKDKNYLVWMLDNMEFDSDKMLNLKKEIRKILSL